MKEKHLTLVVAATAAMVAKVTMKVAVAASSPGIQEAKAQRQVQHDGLTGIDSGLCYSMLYNGVMIRFIGFIITLQEPPPNPYSNSPTVSLSL